MIQNDKLEELRNAIIMQACEDYKEGFRLLYSKYGWNIPQNFEAQVMQFSTYEKNRLREYFSADSFFKSEYFTYLTKIDPKEIVKELKRQVIKEFNFNQTKTLHHAVKGGRKS